MTIRIGFGFDVHQLKTGHPFYMGGVLLDHHSGAFGHSDADVLIHAICDAMLGAANLRDIGFHFSDKDARWKGISSLVLLEHVRDLLDTNGWKVINMDTSICLEAPRIQEHVPAMQILIAGAAGIETDAVSIKATTNEKMGFIGRQEGLTAYAVVLIERTSGTKLHGAS